MIGIKASAFEKLASVQNSATSIFNTLAFPMRSRMGSSLSQSVSNTTAKINDTLLNEGGNIFYTPPVRVVIEKDPKHPRRKGKAIIKLGAVNTLHLMKNRRPVNIPKKNVTRSISESHNTSPALAKAIETSQNPVPAIKANKKNLQPLYAGGNTPANMRQVIRSQEKLYRDDLKKKPGFENVDMRKSY